MHGKLKVDSVRIGRKIVHHAQYTYEWLLVEATGDSEQEACRRVAMVLRGMHPDHPAVADSKHIMDLVYNLNRDEFVKLSGVFFFKSSAR